MTPIPIHIRWMLVRDLASVVTLESEGRATHEVPWSLDNFRRILRKPSVIGMVAEDADGYILGFVVYQWMKRRMDLLNLRVDPRCRRSGIGRRFVDTLVDKLVERERGGISVDVRESNLAGQLFLKGMGFRAVAIHPGFFPRGDGSGFAETAYQMVYTLPVNVVDPVTEPKSESKPGAGETSLDKIVNRNFSDWSA